MCNKQGMKVSELIGELQKLPQDSEIFVNKWFRRKGGSIQWLSYNVKITGIFNSIELDTNKNIYSIDTEHKEIDDILNEQLKRNEATKID